MNDDKTYIQSFLELAATDIDFILSLEHLDLLRKAAEEWVAKEKAWTRYVLKQQQKHKYLSKKESLASRQVSRLSKTRKDSIELATHELHEQHVKEGYLLVQKVREIFTGQEITYVITFENDNKKMTYAYLTIGQLLGAAKIGFEAIKQVSQKAFSKSMVLRLRNPRIKKLVNALEAEMAEGKKPKQQITKVFSGEDEVLWNSLIAYRDSLGWRYKVNEGRINEVFYILRNTPKFQSIKYIGHLPGDKNTEGKAKALMERSLEDDTAGWKKGDVGLEQLKNVSSTARIINAGQILDVLERTLKILDKTNKEQMMQALKTEFIAAHKKKELDIDKKVIDEAEKELEKRINNLKFDKK